MIKLFNTLGREVQDFKPIKEGEVGIYSCGPTVYWFQHIGNLRSYIFADLVKRTFLFNGFKATHVMNYTDVGHLTSDADEGEDKIEKAARREGKTAQDIANYYASVFEKDTKKLNILPVSVVCKATEHIADQIEMIKKLEENGFTYKTHDGIYYDSTKFKDYAKLGLLNIEGLEAGKRIDVGDKHTKTDFALWKFSEEPGKRQQEWESPWGVGFPGWHLECSAMSTKYLGDTFDIHTGGVDHIPIHHTNEIAQSEGATKSKFVNYWMHGEFLTFKGEKVSKSEGGLYTIEELEELSYDPLDFRYLCLLTHYRKQLEFTLENLDAAKQAHERLKHKIIELKKQDDSNNPDEVEEYKGFFLDAINDDINVPKALGILWDALKDDSLGSKEKLELAFEFDKVLGLGLELAKEEKVDVPQEIQDLVTKREEARTNKDFDAADKLRDEIKEKGYVLEDSKDGIKIKKV